MKTPATLLLAALLCLPQVGTAATKLPSFFIKGMVLQSGVPLPVWGTATPGETITVEFAGQTKSAEASADGTWRVVLDPLEPSSEERELKVSGVPTIQGVLVGDVWVCIGDQNMALSPQKGQPDNTGEIPLTRHYVGRGGGAPLPLENHPLASFWAVADGNGLGRLNPVAHGFASAIHEKTGAPVGILNMAGGALLEFMPAQAHKHMTPGGPVEELRKNLEMIDPSSPVGKQTQEAFLEAVRNWKKDAEERVKKGEPPLPIPAAPGAGTGTSSMYNAWLHPLREFPVKGVLFYYNDRTNDSAAAKAEQLKALVLGLRDAFGQPDLPVLVSGFHNFGPDKQGPDRPAGRLSEAARQVALNVPGTGAPTASDVGAPRSYCPVRPQELGRRFALLAQRLAYGDKTLVASGPMLKSHTVQDGKIILTFDEVGGGLESDGPLGGFAIAGGDKKFHWATATIVGNTVELSSPEVPNPVAVHYDTVNFESGSRLRNKEGLPAHPFLIGFEK